MGVKIEISLSEGNEVEDSKGDMEIPFYDHSVIVNATNNFSIDNKLGQGGFGSVYKVNIQSIKNRISDVNKFEF